MRKFTGLVLLLAGLAALLASCQELPDKPKPNQPPETHLFLAFAPEQSPDTTTSKIVLHWYGDDPDGYVTGYRYAWGDPKNLASDLWDSTEATEDTFLLHLSGEDSTFTFQVQAVDNQGERDPSPASLSFPVKNTPPEVQFVKESDVPDSTYPVAAFWWDGNDFDGAETIDYYEWALADQFPADTLIWHQIPANQDILILTEADGLTPGIHKFYLRARDIAGAYSPVVTMPRDSAETWYVKEPRGQTLVVADYSNYDAANVARFYKQMLHDMGQDYSLLDIRAGDGKYLPAVKEAFNRTLLLFNKIIWYADATPTISYAESSLPSFVDDGGSVLFSMSFPENLGAQANPFAFTPVDSASVIYQKNGWLAQPNPDSLQFRDLNFVSESDGWAITQNGIYKSSDAGATWSSSYQSSVELTLLEMVTSQKGYAAGANGTVIATTTSGLSWNPLTTGLSGSVTALGIRPSGYGWIGTDQGELARTADEGNSWQTVTLPGVSEIRSVSVPGDSTIFVLSDADSLYYSKDFGATWIGRVHPAPNEKITKIYFRSSTMGWAIGENGSIYKTLNGGRGAWTDQKRAFDVTNYFDLQFTSDTRGWIAGENGQVLRTTDGGENWIVQVTFMQCDFFSLSFADNQNGWLAGSNKTLLHTTNGGTKNKLTILSSYTGNVVLQRNTSVTDFEPETLKFQGQEFYPKSLVPNVSARALYSLPEDSRWAGQPIIGAQDASGRFTFFGISLHKINGMNNLQAAINSALGYND